MLVEIVESGARNNLLEFPPPNLVLLFLWHVLAIQKQFFADYLEKLKSQEQIFESKIVPREILHRMDCLNVSLGPIFGRQTS